MNINKAKDLDMVDYLARLGYQPTRTAHPNYWYRSPLRDEKTASFKVNQKLNRWIDFATNEKGNLVDFGILYHKCTISEFLQRLAAPGEKFSTHQTVADVKEKDSKINILSVQAITALPLIRYYRERRISDQVAQTHLQEAHYQLGVKNYYALAFPNDAGGYELRNRYFKGSSSPKSPTFIDNGSPELTVTEGFFNYLSHLTILPAVQRPPTNHLILNSTAFFDREMDRMQAHDKVHLFLDNDETGQKCSQKALSVAPQTFIDERQLYKGYNDLNHWHQNLGLAHSNTLRQSP